ncbi:MAG: 30S ribosomal protein S13 [Planctomycetes bacterium]|jgi:small subunit ribosomal protein S13|nr:30S ribosomal protein S13 [Planctomycetota bacterium]
MPRVCGVDIPGEKRIDVSLRYLYGVGAALADRVLEATGVAPSARAKSLSEDDLARIGSYIEKNFVVEGSLRRQIAQNVTRLRDIGCYRGSRHRRSLPVRGQRTRTNARTRKGPRKTVAGKKSVKAVK